MTTHTPIAGRCDPRFAPVRDAFSANFAERGDIVCPCGSQDIAADIRGNSIVLECCHCGAYSVLRAENASDLARIGRGFDIGLAAPKCLRKK